MDPKVHQPISSDENNGGQTVNEKRAGKRKVSQPVSSDENNGGQTVNEKRAGKRKVSQPVSSDENDENQTINEKQAGKRKVNPKKRKLTAGCWKHMKEFYDEEGLRKARCNYCQAVLCAESSKGTTSLNKHINHCEANPENKAKDQPSLVLKKDVDGQGTLKTWKFDPTKVRQLLIKMIIVDELPFCFVEREGFREFIEALCPSFNIPSRFTVTRDILDYYLDEKKKLRSFFINNEQRVSFTTDTWTSIQRVNYMCLTAHFIDNNWKYHKRIISFKQIGSHKGDDIAGSIRECLDEWGIERVMTLTLDNASSNDAAVRKLISTLPNLIGKGKYLHVRCVAHIINLIVQDGLKDQDDIVDCVRNVVKHIRSSPARLAMFKTCVNDKKIESKGLVSLDVSTRWNSTYDMLNRALQLEKTIDMYARKEGSCRKDLNEVPDCTHWIYASKFKDLLENFKIKTVELSCSKYVIAHEVYAEIMEIGDHLQNIVKNQQMDFSFKSMTTSMKLKFQKYFEDDDKSNKLFEFASILDPRVKLTMIEFGCVKSCLVLKDGGLLKTEEEFEERVKEKVNDVKSEMQLLLREYEVADHVGSSIPVTTESKVEQTRGKKTWMGQLEKFRGVASQSSGKKSEFEKYLLEDHEEMRDEFDILTWWKVNSSRYPALAQMAKDILAIPVSTVASESAFSTGGRVVDSYRSSLSPTIVEALICTQDWIRKERKQINEDANDEKFDEFAKDVFEKIESMRS